ncbi:MAG: chromatin modification- protein VID21 [Claussenomyces sp. TS43310]|nr:MAG: chromatin modification- protein VID21 [Claussenomyces sp. TS43310]
MTELVINRSSILQAKRQEIGVIATARKRKLRELYALAYSDVVPQVTHLAAESPITALPEANFLDENDILQDRGRTFNESSIPTTHRLLRSETLKRAAPGPGGVGGKQGDHSRLYAKGHRDGEVKRTRRLTPVKDSSNDNEEDNPADDSGTPRQDQVRNGKLGIKSRPEGKRRSSSGHRRALNPAISATLEDTSLDRHESVTLSSQDSVSAENSEQHRIRNRVESRSGSPGVDPKRAIPISIDDAGRLPEYLTRNHQSGPHKASTIHLPPKEVQEKHLREINHSIAAHAEQDQMDDRTADLSIRLPPPHNARSLDPLSSPDSTIDAHSAATPGILEASTDTSPDDDGPRYDAAEKPETKDVLYPRTPPELLPSKEETSEKDEHDRLLKAQMDIVRADILGSSPTGADAQLRLEEEQAAAAKPDIAREADKIGVADVDLREKQPHDQNLDKGSGETAQELMDDEEEDDEVVGVPTPEDERIQETEVSHTAAAKESGEVSQISGTSGRVYIEPIDVAERSPIDHSTGKLPSPEEACTVRKEQSDSSSAPSTPHRTLSVQASAAVAERMTTRVASGAMRHKSVSEIIGEMPRARRNSSLEKGDRSSSAVVRDSNTQSRSSSSQTTGSRGRSLVQRTKDKERSRLSAVVFAKQSHKQDPQNTTLVSRGTRAPAPDYADYFMPLILAQAYNSPRGIQPLDALLQSAHKTITTSNAYVPFHEHQTQKILRRIHSLQAADKWSFRQPKRAPEPNRPTTHWDELLKEMRWMRTDFREERKWKTAVARNLAYACAEWVGADSDDRRLLQVKAMIPPRNIVSMLDTEMQEATTPSTDLISQPLPDLVPSADNDSPLDGGPYDEEPSASLLDVVAPTAIFCLSDDDVIFDLRRSAATDKLLEELPMYGTPLSKPQSDLPTSDVDPDASWRQPALPLSKYFGGKILLANDGPPRKKSRYEYEEESDEDEQVVLGTKNQRCSNVDPIQIDVALFNPENRHIRDRIHAGHQFRPPSEHPMPLQSFFECRSSSHWLWSEDDELKSLVREYSYNWQLISSMLSTKSLFSSGAERRTPWECFERWIHLEGLPADMQRTHYFRAYNNRMEAAQRHLMAQANQAPQNNAAGAAVTPVRRRTTSSIRVERKRNQKHLTLIDAMRKLAKKRETTAQKQLQAAGMAAMRKTNDNPPQQGTRHTPQDFSRLKHERELQLVQRLQLQEAQRRALQARTAQQQNLQQFGAPGGAPQSSRTAAASNTPGAVQHPAAAHRPGQLSAPAQSLPPGPMQSLPNGMGNSMPISNGNGHGGAPPIPMKGVPQAQMQNMPGLQGLQSQHRLPVPNPGPDLRLVMQARQISEQQRQAVQMQQQSQQHSGQNSHVHNSPPNVRANMNAMSQQNFMQNNQAMMASFGAGNANGLSTPPANGMQAPNNGPAGSPRIGHPHQPQQMHSNGSTILEVNQLEAQYHSQFPNAPPEQIRKMVSDTLKQRHAQRQQISQSAMHAAAGNGGALPGLPGGMQHSPQQYAQMLRAQQERQAQAAQPNRSASVGSGVGK